MDHRSVERVIDLTEDSWCGRHESGLAGLGKTRRYPMEFDMMTQTYRSQDGVLPGNVAYADPIYFLQALSGLLSTDQLVARMMEGFATEREEAQSMEHAKERVTRRPKVTNPISGGGGAGAMNKAFSFNPGRAKKKATSATAGPKWALKF